jgi:hypothetical protein
MSEFLMLNEFWINKLLCIPETGMGYQVVNVKIKYGGGIK